MAPKTAMKAMKTATKDPISMKPMATTAKGKSKNANNYKSTDKNKSVTETLRVYNFKGSEAFEVEGPTQKVAFYYETHMPCTKTPEQLKDIVATILPSLQAMKSASNAHQVHAFV